MLPGFGVEQAHDLADQVVQVGGVELGRRRAREGEEVVDQAADALDLGEREVAERRAELVVAHALGQELDEGAHRDERVADLVCHAGREHAERGEPVGAGEQLARAREVGRHPPVLGQACGACREVLREPEIAGRQRRAAGAADEEQARDAGSGANGYGGAPRATLGRSARLKTIDVGGAVRRDGHQRAARRLLDQQHGALEMEPPGEERHECPGKLGALRVRLGPVQTRSDFLHRPPPLPDASRSAVQICSGCSSGTYGSQLRAGESPALGRLPAARSARIRTRRAPAAISVKPSAASSWPVVTTS